jgi:hypothetical protein
MADIAKHIRIFAPDPSDDYVTKRTTAVTAIETALRKKLSGTDLFKITRALVEATRSLGVCPEDVVALASPPLRKASSSFVVEGEGIQISVCALLATAQLLEKIKESAKISRSELVFAMCLLNGISYRNYGSRIEKFEDLRIEIIEQCKGIIARFLIDARQRKIPKNRNPIQLPADGSIQSLVKNIESSFGSQVDDLLSNSLLDREEIDVLWWVVNGRSKILDEPLTNLSAIQSVVCASLEIGSSLQTIPDEAFIQLACKGVDPKAEVSELELATDLIAFKAQIQSYLEGILRVPQYEEIFPALTLLNGDTADVHEDNKMALSEWANRILLEVTINSVSKFA